MYVGLKMSQSRKRQGSLTLSGKESLPLEIKTLVKRNLGESVLVQYTSCTSP